MKHVVQFSGGICSFWAAVRVVEKFGKQDVTLLFADTLIEDADLYRFNTDVESYLGIKITRICDGRTPWQVFRDHGMIGSSRVDMCSQELKRDLLDRWNKENTDPATTTRYLGLDWSEGNRLYGDDGRGGMVTRFAPWKVEAPMMWAPLWDKRRMAQELSRIGVKLPRLYDMGFPHNNCGGFCVKAGHAHFAHLLKKLPERYAFHENEEEKMRVLVGDYSVLKDRRGGTTKSFPLRKLREMIELGILEYDTDDWGGCGCSVESDV